MSNKTIAKFGGLVILVLVATFLAGSCSHASSTPRSAVNASAVSQDYAKPVVVGTIESGDVIESSGIAASLCQQDVLWTHNDSGDDSFIFAFNGKGRHLGTWRVSNARNDDWEDMASYKSPDGLCYLYIGDIGNNKLGRVQQRVYRVAEPSVAGANPASSKKNALSTAPAEAMIFKYSDTPHNAETLMVQPESGDIYVLTKRIDGPSLVFKIAPGFGSAQPVIALKVGEVNLPAVPNGFLTGGAIAPDGRRVILCDYSAGYELSLGNAEPFDEIWKQKPVVVDLGDRKQGEAVTFNPEGDALLATSERKNAAIFEVRRK